MTSRLVQIAGEETEKLIESLPPELRDRTGGLTITFDERSREELAADGLDETLGLFVGGDIAHPLDVPLPNQIILYLQNLWEETGADEAEFRHEIRVTVLHELGHYLGLDEIDLDERGLQ